jgi:hypothetical protein
MGASGANPGSFRVTSSLAICRIPISDQRLYQTASEVVREPLRLLKARDQAREQLRADVKAGLESVRHNTRIV